MHAERPSPASLRRLRYFRWTPPAGGFGGDWDTLTARARFADEAELGRILAAFGYSASPPLAPGHTDLGDLLLCDRRVRVTLERATPLAGGGGSVGLLAAVYATEHDVQDALQLEAWLDEHHLRMAPGGDAD